MVPIDANAPLGIEEGNGEDEESIDPVAISEIIEEHGTHRHIRINVETRCWCKYESPNIPYIPGKYLRLQLEVETIWSIRDVRVGLKTAFQD